MESGHRTQLERIDAITFEQTLKESIEQLLSFESHSIMFPRKGHATTASLSDNEKRLLLPIPNFDGTILCIFVARGVDIKASKLLLPLWYGISSLISRNLLNYKRSLCDPATGLYTRHYLLSSLERDLDSMRDHSRRGSTPSNKDTNFGSFFSTKNPTHTSATDNLLQSTGQGGKTEGDLPRITSSAVLIVRLSALRDVVREFGYQFADELMVALADCVLEHCPEQVAVARTGDLEFAIGLRSATKKIAEKVAFTLVEAIRKTSIEHPLRKNRIAISPSIGFALFPHDMAGADFLRPPAEQARILLRKARLAAALASEQDEKVSRRVMAFGKILSEGGRIIQVLPLSKVIISIGTNMHAREGLRFSVWSLQENTQAHLTPLYKGEIAIMDVRANTSQAEVIHLGDPSWPLMEGDHLVLLPDEQGDSKSTETSGVVRHDPVTGFLRHGDFLAQWSQLRENKDSFLLAIIRIAPLPGDSNLQEEFREDDKNLLSRHPDQLMAKASAFVRDVFGDDVIAGRYGLNSLVLFHPTLSIEDLRLAYEKLIYLLEDRLHVQMAVGIAPHPFLDFRKSDALENCQKALEYGLLLPAPHIGVLDSLALNISADKKYSQGDSFGAVKEYQRALWADDQNALAWNSLGICYAGLGRLAEAEEYFTKALTCNPSDAMALYNLGFICQSRGEKERAITYFHSCLEHAPEHLFAFIRLGQIAEAEGHKKEAKELYERASKLPGGKGLTSRHFARLALAEGNEEDAREYLHSALLSDPHDAVSLQMLSAIYLDAGEDPEMALSLARQSVSLRPELKSGWIALSRALEALGKVDQARDARLQSGQL